MTIADRIAQEISDRCGVAFTLTGGLIMHVTDALHRAGVPQVCHHHEQAAIFAADGYARQSGRPGCVVVTGGPGGTNTMTGVLSAWQDSIPLLVIVGQCKSSRMIGDSGQRQVGTLACDFVPMVKTITKRAETVLTADGIAAAMDEATSGRPGPVVLEVPLDVQGMEIE